MADKKWVDCAECKQKTPADKKFCANCGKELKAAEGKKEEKKQEVIRKKYDIEATHSGKDGKYIFVVQATKDGEGIPNARITAISDGEEDKQIADVDGELVYRVNFGKKWKSFQFRLAGSQANTGVTTLRGPKFQMPATGGFWSIVRAVWDFNRSQRG